MIIYNRTQYKKLTNEQYQEEKRFLQIELLKLQEWVINYNKSVAILFESNREPSLSNTPFSNSA